MKHLVFVYGTLKKGYHNDFHLYDCCYYGKGTTAKKYVMLKCCGLPFVVNVKCFDSTLIKGEVYLIDDFTLNELDYLEGHPNFYKRQKIKVYVKGIQLECWCYFLNISLKGNDCKIIKNGKWEE